jgi:hypothetical protein
VHNETQTAIAVAPESAVDEGSSDLNEKSRGSVVHIPDVPLVSTSGPSGIAEQSVAAAVELETSVVQSDALMHDSQPMVRPELLGQAEGRSVTQVPTKERLPPRKVVSWTPVLPTSADAAGKNERAIPKSAHA